MNDDTALLVIFGTYAALWLVAIILYVLPSYFAFRRHHPNRWLILVVNIAFGATVIGWGLALVWALRIVHLPGDGTASQGGQSGLNLFANDVKRVRVEPTLTNSNFWEKAAPASADDALQQIERLRQLYDQGHIDQAEFAQLKATVLKKL